MPQRPRRKLFFPPGLISLAILPLFLIYYVEMTTRAPEYALEVIYPNHIIITVKDTVGANSWKKFEFTMQQDLLALDKSCFPKIVLCGDENEDIKLRYAQIAIHELAQGKADAQGIEFQLTSHARYASLVKLYDLCKRENAKRYIHYHDKFWVLGTPPPKPRDIPEVRLGCGMANWCCIPNEVKASEPLIYSIKRFWPSALLFVLLFIGLCFKVFHNSL